MSVVTHHARKRARQRAGYRDVDTQAERAWKIGKGPDDVASRTLRVWMLRTANRGRDELRYYRGRCWIFSSDGVLITILQIPLSVTRAIGRGR